jgi:hypothetical protein
MEQLGGVSRRKCAHSGGCGVTEFWGTEQRKKQNQDPGSKTLNPGHPKKLLEPL